MDIFNGVKEEIFGMHFHFSYIATERIRGSVRKYVHISRRARSTGALKIATFLTASQLSNNRVGVAGLILGDLFNCLSFV